MSGVRGRPVVLVGMMGVGKSTVGRLVAEATGWGFIDLDEVVAARAGTGIPALFTTEGEAAFRRREVEVLASVLEGEGPCVIAAGGGLVVSPEARRLLVEGTRCVYLRARVGTLVPRVGSGDGRPLLKGDPAAVLENLLVARGALYEEVATSVVDVDALDADEVATLVLEAVGAPC